MDHYELKQIANAIVEMWETQKKERGGAPRGGASFLESPDKIVAWSRRTSRYLGDPAWGPDDLLQELLMRIMMGEEMALMGKTNWIYEALRRGDVVPIQDFAVQDLSSDIEMDIKILLHWKEWEVLRLSIDGSMSQPEVAKEMQCSERQVRNLMQRARLKIKAYLYGGYNE